MREAEKVYEVFISSTYLDNVTRRQVVLEAIERAGRMIAVRMERFTADERPAVEVCLEGAARCDLFVGIIAHRYGWEPDGQAPGEEKSITWMEYEAARAANRPCLMFEIDPKLPYTRADQDPGEDIWRKAGKLDQFKKAYAKNHLAGHFNEGNLGMVVQQALFGWRERQEASLPRSPTPSAPARPSSLSEDLERYRSKAIEAHGTILLSGFKVKLRVPIDLEELYIPLLATRDLRGQGGAGFADSRHAKDEMAREGRGQEETLTGAFRLAARLTPRRRGLVVLGEPGSGKTTHLKRLLLYCLKKGPEELGLPAGMVPVFLPLRDLEDADHETVEHFIERHLDAQLEQPGDSGEELLKLGNLLLLFDGLDEVADPRRREKAARWVERVLKKHPSCWPVVTCRFAGYGEQGGGRGEVRLGAEFLELHIQPLRGAQIEDFVRKWYRLVETGLDTDREGAVRLAEQRAGELLAQLRKGDMRTTRVAEMVGNPLLLANLCLVHRDHGRLPEDRRRLYDESVDVLLERWKERPGALGNVKVEQARRVLQPVAEWLHREEQRTRASGEELQPVLEPALKAVRWEAGGARGFLGTVRDESGLLTGWGPDQFGFMHLGFQEYLAASELRRLAAEGNEKQRAEVLEKLAGHYGKSWWQEVLLLFVAMGNPSMFGPLMREVVKRKAFAEQPGLLGMLLEEAAEKDPRPFVELLQKTGNDAGLRARQRAAVEALRRMGEGEELAKLAGKRKRGARWQELLEWLGVASTPADGVEVTEVTEKGGVELVPIPGGEFLMGSPESEFGRLDTERPQHPVKVSSFWIGRYPVTNEQYGRFLKENPHVAEPRFWGDRKFNQPQQPVVGVSWGEARAFAEWAGGRLPTEAEWEYACRAGTKGPRYERKLDAIAWYDENSGGSTPPVGLKKPNAWDLYDMLGNVWEWCGGWAGKYPSNGALVTDPAGPVAGSSRVVRGGSWNSGARDVRAAYRGWYDPATRYDYLGLRLARGQLRPAKQGGAQGAAERPK